ncbi:MAG: Nramp family divalent metal transporter [Bacteroidetes bacterium]|nr:Nramp family divalent metal transporter [Bacteroidota bacterium]MDA0938401.1 Nramp family divalent metal transporter [Bacteroidota bacterium]MDA1344876.1 Nramp family divalent metal transporter [Bacteroidota bacterium]
MALRKLQIGPGVLVTAAFIGPGTLTVCTMAGVHAGTQLLWVVVLATLITIFIQNIAARIAWKTGSGLATSMIKNTAHPLLRWFFLVLILAAILVGNTAYQGGNLSGAFLGFDKIVTLPSFSIGNQTFALRSLIIGVMAAWVLWKGNTRLIKNILLSVVLLMSASFLIAAILVQPNFMSLVKGLLLPQIPQGDWKLVVALLGTTIVPYNLFLHAALVKSKNSQITSLAALKRDTQYAVCTGGLISICIIIAASAVQGAEISSVTDLGKSLVPIYGNRAEYFVAFGLFAAGFSSAITAPLAAGYVAEECMQWSADSKKSKWVALLVLTIGLTMTLFELRPIEIIRLAQWANGLLLPLVGLFLWALMRKEQNRMQLRQTEQLIMGLIIVFFCVLTLRSLGFLA